MTHILCPQIKTTTNTLNCIVIVSCYKTRRLLYFVLLKLLFLHYFLVVYEYDYIAIILHNNLVKH